MIAAEGLRTCVKPLVNLEIASLREFFPASFIFAFVKSHNVRSMVLEFMIEQSSFSRKLESTSLALD